MNNDREHLKLLSIFYYIFGGLTFLGGCFPSIYIAIGIALVSGAMRDGAGDGPPPAVGWFFIVGAVVVMALSWGFAACIVLAGKRLAAYRSYTFCMVVACILLCFMPLGTILGVFTIIVLVRPSVKQLFDASRSIPEGPFRSDSPFGTK